MNHVSEISNSKFSIDDSELIEKIERLKVEKNAIILAHFYQRPEIQDIADKVGDSLELAKFAHQSDASILVFCGVVFMAETAKILNPKLKVLVPDMNAGCGLSDSLSPTDFKSFIDDNSDRYVVSYINTSAEIKAMSDVICTSSNALKIIENIPNNRKILFAPDKNLGKYLEEASGRDIKCWQGICYVHEAFSIEKVIEIKKEFPSAKIIAHPESAPIMIQLAEFVGSTSALIKYIEESNGAIFIIATEAGIIHDIQKKVKGKKIIPAPIFEDNTCACSECSYMKVNTIRKIYDSLKYEKTQINLSDQLMEEASLPLMKMIEQSS